MTKKHKVLKILGNPLKTSMMLGNEVIEYWEVKVLMGCEDLVYESSATFASKEDAKSLKIGMTFNR